MAFTKKPVSQFTDQEYLAYLDEVIKCLRCPLSQPRRMFPQARCRGQVLYYRRWCRDCLLKYQRRVNEERRLGVSKREFETCHSHDAAAEPD